MLMVSLMSLMSLMPRAVFGGFAGADNRRPLECCIEADLTRMPSFGTMPLPLLLPLPPTR